MLAVQDEAVEVRVGPAHQKLERVMQISDRTVSTNPCPAPDRWAEVAQRDPKLVDLGCGDIPVHVQGSKPISPLALFSCPRSVLRSLNSPSKVGERATVTAMRSLASASA